MKPAELRLLLGPFIFFVLTAPSMGGLARISQRLCGSLQDPCVLGVDFGSCYEIHFRYFYNKTSQRCESFIFTGCDGNLNNYKLKIECQVACEQDYKIPYQEKPGGNVGQGFNI